MSAVTSIAVRAVCLPDQATTSEALAVEQPLQVFVNDQAFAVVMRTPGQDRELVVGLLLGEGILSPEGAPLAEFAAAPATRDCDVCQVTVPAPYVCPNLAAHRSLTATSACGICGQRQWQPLDLPPLAAVAPPDLPPLFRQLRAAQQLFSSTGGAHAAAIFSASGNLLAFAEDVGRHNAVDKVIGALALSGQPTPPASVLVVSGRLAHELVAKAWRARLSVIAGVSAPTSAAVALARRAGMQLYGFCRDDRATCYTPSESSHE